MKATNVSRETLEKLSVYADMLEKWQKSINLVSPTTIKDMWFRHFYDSAQLAQYYQSDQSKTEKPIILDIGSGAGFPGLVLSMMGVGHVHLVETVQKKAMFMKQVIRETDIDATVHAVRIENLDAFHVDFISSRALASLDKLFTLTQHFHHDGLVCIFPKGQTADEEIKEAEKKWSFEAEKFTSITEESATILRLRSIKAFSGLKG